MADHFDSGAPLAENDAEKDDSAETSVEEILSVARSRLKLAAESEEGIRREALDDLKFRSGDQWPDDIKEERARDGRPCLVVNRLPQFTHQITNDQRQNRPAIKVHPEDDQADEDTGKIIQGLIRHIEVNSNADAAYDTGLASAVNGGFGYWRILPDYVSPDSFDQELYIRRIRNPLSVFLDPYAESPDGSDANWGFITDDFSPDEYRALYPDSKLASQESDLDAIGNTAPGWVESDSVRVAEYFYKDWKDATLYQLSTGETVREERLVERMAAAQAAGLDATVVKKRETKIPTVKWLKINAVEILEETELPIQFIPIIPVYGDELYIDGKRILESLIRHAKDPQRMHNYWKSAETETIALAPRAPYVGAEGQFEGREEQWATANKKNHAFLEYVPVSIGGTPAPPPQRQNFEPAVQAITQAALASADDLKATTGIYEAGHGQQGNETSGIAIQRRNTQVQTANFHFVDNLTRSLKHTGRILVDWIPHIYDTARTARILGDDGTQKVVKINQEHQDESGKTVLYDLSVGRYGVSVDTGPSFASKRQEAAASMIEFTKAVPQIAAACADLVVKNMDWPGSQEFADRIKKTLPPALQDDPKTKDIPPQIIAQLQQQGQMIQGLTQNLNECTKVIETKQLELEHRERVEVLKIQADAEIQMAKLGSTEAIALLQAKFTEMEHRLSLLKMNQPIEAPDNFNPEQADGGNYTGGIHIGGSENLTGGASPGSSMEGN